MGQRNDGGAPRPVAVLLDVSQSMDQNDPRPNPDDQWRAALAFDLIEPNKPFPTNPFVSVVSEGKMPNRPTRLEVARAALSNPKIDLLNRLKKVGPLEISTFGASRSGKDAFDTAWLKTVAADQPRTALVNAALELLNRDENEHPAAVVIVTDGRENASDKSLTELAEKYRARRIPLYVYGVGSSSFGQLRVRDAGVPESAFLDDTVTVPVRYAVRGVTEGTVDIEVEFGVLFKLTDQTLDELRARKVSDATLARLSALKNTELRRADFERSLAAALSADEKEKFFGLILNQAKFAGREVAAKRGIPVKEGDDLREVLTFPLTKEDAALKNQEITVRVMLKPGAAGVTLDTLTDFISKPTQIVSKKLKVLVVDGLPRKDFQFLQRALLRDRRVDARFFLTEGDREAMKLGDPWLTEFTRQLNGTLALEREEFRKLVNEYDLLILGDIPGKFFSREHQQVIKEFVAEGGGMVHIAGRVNSPRGWLEAERGEVSIADVLPVELPAVKFPIQPPEGRYYQPFVPALAPTAVRNPLVSLEDDPLDNAELWGARSRPDRTTRPHRRPTRTAPRRRSSYNRSSGTTP